MPSPIAKDQMQSAIPDLVSAVDNDGPGFYIAANRRRLVPRLIAKVAADIHGTSAPAINLPSARSPPARPGRSPHGSRRSSRHPNWRW
jgi:hypothetical protein